MMKRFCCVVNYLTKGKKICIITPFGLQYDQFAYTPLCSLAAALHRLNVSLMRFPGVPTFRCAMSITVTGPCKDCTASITRTGIVDCSSTRGLQACILCLCCQRHCDKSIYDQRIPIKYLQTRFGNLKDGNYWVKLTSSANRYITIYAQLFL
jgi:hypothetical protein